MSLQNRHRKNPTEAPVSGLYAIVDTTLVDDDHIEKAVASALLGGARIIQYRDKSDDHHRRRHQARRLLALCQQYKRPLIINDDVTLAKEIGAQGVHLGRDNCSLTEARQQLGYQAIIGISCYNQIQRALDAESGGADYVAFGSFFRSETKPEAVTAPLSLLTDAKTRLALPIVAIGGINPENAPSLIAAGADAIAVISDLFAKNDIQAAAERYSLLFSS